MNLDNDYRFENFIVGPSNQFAYFAAIAVAEKPAQSYNPFLMYGNAALGKTHLLNAIGLKIVSLYPALNIICVSAETFKNELIISIHSDETQTFRDKYTNIDCLLIDDIQMIVGQERMQTEFCQILRPMCDMNKQIVITCNQSPENIPNFEGRRLFKKIEWSLIADIQEPCDIETKIAIIERMANKLDLKLTGDFIQYLVLKTDTMKDIYDQLLANLLLKERK